MPSLLDATVGGVSSNSYANAAYWDTYFALRLNSAAAIAMVTADKEQALITATARLELERWKGDRSTTTQALDWPRQFVWDDKNNAYFSSTAIPTILQQAVCEFGYALSLDAALMRDDGLGKFKSLEVVGEWKADFRPGVKDDDLPGQVSRMLAPLLISGSGFVRMSRA